MDLTRRWNTWRRPERWTIKQSADVVYREVLKERGFKRQGNNFYREDFLRREVSFYAARWRAAHERTLDIVFTLGWAGLPDEVAGWQTINVTIGGAVKKEFRQPRVAGGSLDPRVVEIVGGPVLEYLNRPTTPEWVIDTILASDALPVDPRCHAHGGTVGHAVFATWGAVAIRDSERCALALDRARSQAEAASWKPDWHLGLVEAVDKGWQEIHGIMRPVASRAP
ncbi:hypothetical protein [Demequina sp.]|uniref:hypothetical protein n=1 Tax=Demequina sp. TaxID=2050685 RepID=UPI003D12A05B